MRFDDRFTGQASDPSQRGLLRIGLADAGASGLTYITDVLPPGVTSNRGPGVSQRGSVSLSSQRFLALDPASATPLQPFPNHLVADSHVEYTITRTANDDLSVALRINGVLALTGIDPDPTSFRFDTIGFGGPPTGTSYQIDNLSLALETPPLPQERSQAFAAGVILDDETASLPRHSILGPKQVVVSAGERVALPLRYSFSVGDPSAHPFQLSLYFDSTKVRYDSFRTIAGLESPQITTKADTNNGDADPTTDQILALAWSGDQSSLAASLQAFPGGDPLTGYPLPIGAPVFQALGSFTGSTAVAFGSSTISSGQLLVADPVTLASTPAPWTLDVDGSGRYEVASDARLLLRYGLGTFPGASLTAGSLDAESSRVDPSAILAELQRGVASQRADLDGNGRFTPLSDGLLALAYGGTGLISATSVPPGLLAPDASRSSAASLWAHLQAVTPPGPI